MKDWDSLRYVLAIMRGGGLSAAARELGVNHATVSRQLARAEAEAGTALFTRLATGMVATEAGEEAARRAATIEAEVLALDLSLASRDDRTTGALAVTAPPLILASGLAADIARYQGRFPNVALSISGDNTILNLHRREADVAVRVARHPEESLWGRVIARQRAGWFATPQFVERHFDRGEPVPILSFVHWKSPVPSELDVLHQGARVAMTVDDMDSAVALVRAGVAMARMPLFLGIPDPAIALFPGLPLLDYAPIWVLTHPDLRQVPRVSEFMAEVTNGFAARQTRYDGADLRNHETKP